MSTAITEAAPQPGSPAGEIAQNISKLSQMDSMGSWSGYFQALALLFLLVAALAAILWLVKRSGGIKLLTGQTALSLESRLALGPKKNLVVVRFLNKKLLLGVTDHQITLLLELPVNEHESELPITSQGSAPSFSSLLAKETEKGKEPE